MRRRTAAGQVLLVVPVAADGESVPGRKLDVALQPPDVLRPRGGNVHVERGEAAGGGKDQNLWLALVFVVGEEVRAIFDDRTAECRADLLILIGQDHVLDLVGGVQLGVAEVPADATGERVGPRLGDRVGDHPGGAPCVASKRLVITSNSAIESREKRGWSSPMPM